MANKLMAYIICINTDDSYMRLGPWVTTESLTDTIIKNRIHETLLENDCDFYTVADIEDLVVIGCSDSFDMIYSPKIEDVWLRDFGPKGFSRYVKKGGDNL